jgi:hypothetical protein
MSEFRRRLLMRQNEIPYQQVEYLQSDSSAYIDTGIGGGSDDLEIECVFEYSKFIVYGAIYGNWIDDSTDCIRCILSDTQLRGYDNLNTAPVRTTKVNLYINTKIYYKSNYLEIYDSVGVKQRLFYDKGRSNNDNIALFNRSITAPNTERNIGLKVYSFKISKSDEVLRDFLPVRVGDVGYMYDKVSKQLFGSIGTGQFILGQDI